MTTKLETKASGRSIEARLKAIESRLEDMVEVNDELTASILRIMFNMQPIGNPFWVEVIPIKNHGPALQPPAPGIYLLTLSSGSMTFDEYIPEDGRFESYDWDEIAAWALLPTPFRRKTK